MTRFIINTSHKINKKTLRQKKEKGNKQKIYNGGNATNKQIYRKKFNLTEMQIIKDSIVGLLVKNT